MLVAPRPSEPAAPAHRNLHRLEFRTRCKSLFTIGFIASGIVIGLTATSCDSRKRTTERPASGEAESTSESRGAAVQVIGFGPGGVELDYGARFVGSESCGGCHAEQFDMQKSHHMARTSQRVTEQSRDLWFAPARLAKGVRWPRSETRPAPRYRRDPDGSVVLEAVDWNGEEQSARVAAVFGSGNRGFTPIGVEQDGIRELRVSYFRDEEQWVLTPGTLEDPDPLGYVRSHESSQRCLECHMTALSWERDHLDVEASVFGIECERCHGPGGEHEEAAFSESDSLKIFNPGSLRNDEQVRFCGQCHRRPRDAEPHRVFRQAPQLARHAGIGLMLSECFRRSPPASTVTCLECHDPHRNIDLSSDDFNRPCSRCHEKPEDDHKTTEVSKSSDCVECHMPTEPKGFFGLKFTSHWIRVPNSPPPLASPEKDEYARFLEQSYREAIASPGLGDERKCRLRMRLGKLLVGQGQQEEGLRWLREALTFAPLYKDRIVAAEFHERAKRREEAIAILRETIRLVPEHNRAYYTLAKIYRTAGKVDLVREVLEAWGKARPGDPVLEDTRARLRMGPRPGDPND